MKKLFTLAIVALSLILTPAVPTQAKAVTYTREKHEKRLDTASRYSTVHFKVTTLVKQGKQSKGMKVVADISADTKTNLAKVKVVINGLANTKTEYVYDLNDDSIHMISGAPGSVYKENAIMQLAKNGIIKGATSRDVVEQMLKEMEISIGIKGKAAGGKETYGAKLSRKLGSHQSKVSVTCQIKKVKKGYLPVKTASKISINMGGNESSTLSQITFKAFNNERVSLPKN